MQSSGNSLWSTLKRKTRLVSLMKIFLPICSPWGTSLVHAYWWQHGSESKSCWNNHQVEEISQQGWQLYQTEWPTMTWLTLRKRLFMSPSSQLSWLFLSWRKWSCRNFPWRSSQRISRGLKGWWSRLTMHVKLLLSGKGEMATWEFLLRCLCFIQRGFSKLI